MIFIVIFSNGFPNTKNYVLYATSGLIFWFFFANVTNQSVSSIISSSGLIKSLNIPTIFFPLSEILSELFNLFLTFIVYIILMFWFGLHYSFNLLLIIPCALLFGLFSFGLALILSSINVFFRDIGIMWATVQPAVLFLTPIAYPENIIPDRYKAIIQCNPIYYYIRLARAIFYEGSAPPLSLWMYCLAFSITIFLFGLFVFNKLKNQFISSI